MSVDAFSAAAARRKAATGDWRDGLAKTEQGITRKNLHNACIALRDHPALAGKLAHDDFNGCTFVRGKLPWDQQKNRPWSDVDDLAATEWLQSPAVNIQVGSGIVREAVQRVACEQRFHPRPRMARKPEMGWHRAAK
jgi:putative DNA primase/helicase